MTPSHSSTTEMKQSRAFWVQTQVASALIRGWRPTRPQTRGGRRPVFEPIFSAQPGPVPDSIALHSLPAALQMFAYAREQQAQACSADPEAWAVQNGEEDGCEAVRIVLFHSVPDPGTAPTKTSFSRFAPHVAWASQPLCAA